jgi:UDP-N-acetylmuramoyl-tripeptide--D-alanyl-D-alanine ligase
VLKCALLDPRRVTHAGEPEVDPQAIGAIVMSLWHWSELCAALGLPPAAGPAVSGVTIDSRLARPGDLFVALPGDPGPRFNPSYRSDRDGHDYIEAAVANGAVGVLAHDGRARAIPQLQVRDTLDGLWALGRAARARLNCPVIAVTGSSGKTTAKTFLAAALGAFATEGSLNNHLGVPLSLARTPRDAGAAVYEIGTNHPGEIAPLSELARPHVALVLNVHPAHRENFRDLDELRHEKLSLYRGLGGKGQLILEESLETGPLPEGTRILRFGRGPLARVQLLGLDGTTARYRIGDRLLSAHVPGGGAHRALTLAAVLCVLDVLGIDPARGAALPDELVPAGRGRRHEIAGLTVIDDSYNANPESMAAALRTLAAEPAGRRFALVGEMLELGADGPAYHRNLAPLCADLDGVFCIGEGMRALADALAAAGRPGYWQAQADDALLDRLAAALRAGDMLLVKGSNRVFWVKNYLDRLLQRLGGA